MAAVGWNGLEETGEGAVPLDGVTVVAGCTAPNKDVGAVGTMGAGSLEPPKKFGIAWVEAGDPEDGVELSEAAPEAAGRFEGLDADPLVD